MDKAACDGVSVLIRAVGAGLLRNPLSTSSMETLHPLLYYRLFALTIERTKLSAFFGTLSIFSAMLGTFHRVLHHFFARLPRLLSFFVSIRN